MYQRLLKQLMLHYALVMGVVLLLVVFVSVWFFYVNFYLPMVSTADIYRLKGEVNATTINTARFDTAYNALKQKTSPANGGDSLDGLRSPF